MEVLGQGYPVSATGAGPVDIVLRGMTVAGSSSTRSRGPAAPHPQLQPRPTTWLPSVSCGCAVQGAERWLPARGGKLAALRAVPGPSWELLCPARAGLGISQAMERQGPVPLPEVLSWPGPMVALSPQKHAHPSLQEPQFSPLLWMALRAWSCPWVPCCPGSWEGCRGGVLRSHLVGPAGARTWGAGLSSAPPGPFSAPQLPPGVHGTFQGWRRAWLFCGTQEAPGSGGWTLCQLPRASAPRPTPALPTGQQETPRC